MALGNQSEPRDNSLQSPYEINNSGIVLLYGALDLGLGLPSNLPCRQLIPTNLHKSQSLLWLLSQRAGLCYSKRRLPIYLHGVPEYHDPF